jgi:hypothetical protein
VQDNGPGVLLTLMVGLLLDGMGQMVGYAVGAGGALDNAHEFDRIDRHVCDADRSLLQPSSHT